MCPTLDADRVTERLSENGNFLSISYVIVAESREQMRPWSTELKACRGRADADLRSPRRVTGLLPGS